MSLRTAVVGVGHLGRQHARIHRQLADEGRIDFVYVCDMDEATARTVATERHVEAVTDWRALLGRVDAVSLVVPTEAHCEIACAFLEAGAHVLCEKPLARSLEEADRMIEAAAKSGRVLQIGHLERFNPALVALRPHVHNPLYFEIHRVGQFTARSLDIDVVLDLMIHDLDIVQWLVGADVETTDVRAVGIPVLTKTVDAANARIEFATGAVANITASRVGMEKIRKMRFFQPHDYVAVDYATHYVGISSLGAPTPNASSSQVAPTTTSSVTSQTSVAPPQSSSASLLGAWLATGSGVQTMRPEVRDIEPLYAETEAFVRAARGEIETPISGADGRRALRLALEVLDSIHRHDARAGLNAFGNQAARQS